MERFILSGPGRQGIPLDTWIRFVERVDPDGCRYLAMERLDPKKDNEEEGIVSKNEE
jgi:hypothetical protein